MFIELDFNFNMYAALLSWHFYTTPYNSPRQIVL